MSGGEGRWREKVCEGVIEGERERGRREERKRVEVSIISFLLSLSFFVTNVRIDIDRKRD